MSTSLRLGMAEFRTRPGRALLPGAALVVGVACLLAALILSDSMVSAVEEGKPVTPSTVDLVVKGNPRDYVVLDQAAVDRLSAAGRAVPVLSGNADLLLDGRATEWRTRFDVEYADLPSLPLAAGRAPAADGEVVIDKLTAYRHDLKPGDKVRFADLQGKPFEVSISGVTKRGGLGEQPVVAVGPTLARKLDPQPLISAVWMIGADEAAVRAAVPGVSIGGSAGIDGMGNDLKYLLLPFSIVALATSVFVAGATFRAVYLQRQRQTALLRCLGAQRGPLVRRSLAEALITGSAAGLAGALLGGPTAWLLARVFDVTGISGLFGAAQLSPALLPTPGYVVLGVVVAALLSAFAAVRPALAASRVSPLAALRTTENQAPTRAVKRLRYGFGVTLVLLAVALAGIAVLGKGTISAAFAVTFSGIFALAGLFGVLGPVVVPAIGRLFGRLGGAHWRLASAEVRRMPQRSSSVAMPLVLASALVVFFVVLTSVAQGLAEDFGDEPRPDAVITDSADRPLPRIADEPEVAASVVAHRKDAVLGVDPERMKSWLRAQNFGGGERFGPGKALVADNEQPGTTVTVDGRAFEVVGTVPAGAVGWSSTIVADTTIGPPVKMFVALKPGADPAAYRDHVRASLGDAPTVLVGTAAGDQAEVDRYLHLGTVLMMVLLGLSVAVAVTGIGTALTISVQERRKELALRRALGVTREGLQGGVIAEATLLALVGVIGGGVGGFVYAELAIVAAGADDLLLPPVTSVVPLLVGGVTVVLLAVLAAFGPSRSASRIRPAAGLASG